MTKKTPGLKLSPKEFELIRKEIRLFKRCYRRNNENYIAAHKHYTTVQINSERATISLINAAIFKTMYKVLCDMEDSYRDITFKS